MGARVVGGPKGERQHHSKTTSKLGSNLDSRKGRGAHGVLVLASWDVCRRQ